MDEETKKLADEYKALCHAMQTGVAFTMEKEPAETAPKHLRTGVNSALVDSSALACLLMKKGIITEREYYEALRDGMAAEVEAYEKRLKALHGSGAEIKLA